MKQLVIREVPDGLSAALETAAASQGLTVEEFVLNSLKEAVKERDVARQKALSRIKDRKARLKEKLTGRRVDSKRLTR